MIELLKGEDLLDPDKVEFIFLSFAIVLSFFIAFYLLYRKRRGVRELDRKLYGESFPKTRYVEASKIRFCYQQIGRGPDLILVHGLGANLFSWRFVLNRLAQHFTVTTLDLPGFGESTKDPNLKYDRGSQVERLHSLLKALSIKRCYLIGSSMGGTICLEYAIKYPKQIDKLICLAPATHPKILPFNPKPFYQPLSHTYKIVNRLLIKTLLSRVVFHKELVTNDSVDRYYRPYKKNRDATLCALKASEVISDPIPSKLLARISTPSLVLYGENDAVVAKKYIEKLMAELPHSQLLTRSEVGHHSMEDDPKWVTDVAIDFFLTDPPKT
ncbi:alpha/beta hydrolase [Bdellovibrionales bacterium]|nr:alpha/beta hydrolase [Bdellovibrionales bacterium]